MKKIKLILNNPLFILFLSGLFLNISFFFTNILAEILAFFVIAPAFYALTKLEYKKRYLGGLLFLEHGCYQLVIGILISCQSGWLF